MFGAARRVAAAHQGLPKKEGGGRSHPLSPPPDKHPPPTTHLPTPLSPPPPPTPFWRVSAPEPFVNRTIQRAFPQTLTSRPPTPPLHTFHAGLRP
eukprot:80855-Chlamydomonas_euryale.AAC.2